MKKIFMASLALTVLAVSIGLFEMTSCTKTIAQTKTDTVHLTDTIYKCPNSIIGLWEGTYSSTTSSPFGVTSFYFSFSIHSDGTATYKSLASGVPGYIDSTFKNFADGNWTLNGTKFIFSVKTINYPGTNVQHSQSGYATYNASNGTLTNGYIIDNTSGGSAIWTMTKVN